MNGFWIKYKWISKGVFFSDTLYVWQTLTVHKNIRRICSGEFLMFLSLVSAYLFSPFVRILDICHSGVQMHLPFSAWPYYYQYISNRSKKKRVTWFNLSFSKSISTNISAKFLQPVDSCFPPGHELHKLANRNTIKVSYSTTPNMAQHIRPDLERGGQPILA